MQQFKWQQSKYQKKNSIQFNHNTEIVENLFQNAERERERGWTGD